MENSKMSNKTVFILNKGGKLRRRNGSVFFLHNLIRSKGSKQRRKTFLYNVGQQKSEKK